VALETPPSEIWTARFVLRALRRNHSEANRLRHAGTSRKPSEIELARPYIRVPVRTHCYASRSLPS
jgi:hypothetical protein